MGSGTRGGGRGGRRARRGRRTGRDGHGSSVPSVSRSTRSSRALPPTVPSRRRARPDEGTRLGGRTAVPGCRGGDRRSDGRRRRTPAPFATAPRVIGGRYGLSSKEFTPAMVKAVFDELAQPRPKRHFTVGIVDDVTHLSLRVDDEFEHQRSADEVQAMFFGLGSDGTVGANKESVKIIGESDRAARAGVLRVRLEEVRIDDRVAPPVRAGPDPIDLPRSHDADFVACHQFGLLERIRRPRRRQAGRNDPAQRPVPARRGVGPPPAARCSRRSSTSNSTSGSIDAYRGRPRRRHGQPHQHRDAALLLRARPACCRPTRRSPRSSSRIETTYGKRGANRSSTATSQPSTPSLDALEHVEVPASATSIARRSPTVDPRRCAATS